MTKALKIINLLNREGKGLHARLSYLGSVFMTTMVYTYDIHTYVPDKNTITRILDSLGEGGREDNSTEQIAIKFAGNFTILILKNVLKSFKYFPAVIKLLFVWLY